jgi:hypothetical protein
MELNLFLLLFLSPYQVKYPEMLSIPWLKQNQAQRAKPMVKNLGGRLDTAKYKQTCCK